MTSLIRMPVAAAAITFVSSDTEHSIFTQACHMEMTVRFTWILKFTKNVSKDNKTLGQYIFCI